MKNVFADAPSFSLQPESRAGCSGFLQRKCVWNNVTSGKEQQVSAALEHQRCSRDKSISLLGNVGATGSCFMNFLKDPLFKMSFVVVLFFLLFFSLFLSNQSHSRFEN